MSNGGRHVPAGLAEIPEGGGAVLPLSPWLLWCSMTRLGVMSALAMLVHLRVSRGALPLWIQTRLQPLCHSAVAVASLRWNRDAL